MASKDSRGKQQPQLPVIDLGHFLGPNFRRRPLAPLRSSERRNANGEAPVEPHQSDIETKSRKRVASDSESRRNESSAELKTNLDDCNAESQLSRKQGPIGGGDFSKTQLKVSSRMSKRQKVYFGDAWHSDSSESEGEDDTSRPHSADERPDSTYNNDQCSDSMVSDVKESKEDGAKLSSTVADDKGIFAEASVADMDPPKSETQHPQTVAHGIQGSVEGENVASNAISALPPADQLQQRPGMNDSLAAEGQKTGQIAPQPTANRRPMQLSHSNSNTSTSSAISPRHSNLQVMNPAKLEKQFLFARQNGLRSCPLPAGFRISCSQDDTQNDTVVPVLLLCNLPRLCRREIGGCEERRCVMCGKYRRYLETRDEHTTEPIILSNNKGICSTCEVKVWVMTENGLDFKWCCKCKYFRRLNSFPNGVATMCMLQHGGNECTTYSFKSEGDDEASSAKVSSRPQRSADERSDSKPIDDQQGDSVKSDAHGSRDDGAPLSSIASDDEVNVADVSFDNTNPRRPEANGHQTVTQVTLVDGIQGTNKCAPQETIRPRVDEISRTPGVLVARPPTAGTSDVDQQSLAARSGELESSEGGHGTISQLVCASDCSSSKVASAHDSKLAGDDAMQATLATLPANDSQQIVAGLRAYNLLLQWYGLRYGMSQNSSGSQPNLLELSPQYLCLQLANLYQNLPVPHAYPPQQLGMEQCPCCRRLFDNLTVHFMQCEDCKFKVLYG